MHEGSACRWQLVQQCFLLGPFLGFGRSFKEYATVQQVSNRWGIKRSSFSSTRILPATLACSVLWKRHIWHTLTYIWDTMIMMLQNHPPRARKSYNPFPESEGPGIASKRGRSDSALALVIMKTNLSKHPLERCYCSMLVSAAWVDRIRQR